MLTAGRARTLGCCAPEMGMGKMISLPWPIFGLQGPLFPGYLAGRGTVGMARLPRQFNLVCGQKHGCEAALACSGKDTPAIPANIAAPNLMFRHREDFDLVEIL